MDGLLLDTRLAICVGRCRATLTTWDDFCSDNIELGEAELTAIEVTLCRCKVYLGGGAAGAQWTIFHEEMIEPVGRYD